jgi:hypothetical protein
VEVTAPDGRSIASRSTEIPAASYMNVDDGTGHTGASVLVPFPLDGNYSIKVVPKPGASPNDTYTLTVTRVGITTIVAENVKLQDIPLKPYSVTVLQRIAIAIRPDDEPQEQPPTINLKSHGKIPVVILSNAFFNASGSLDRNSLTFGRTGNEQSLAFCKTGEEDLNGTDVDGESLPALVCHFNIQQTGFLVGDTVGVLKGKTLNGIPFTGSGPVIVIQK